MSRDPFSTGGARDRDPLHPVDWANHAGATDDVLRAMDTRLRQRRTRKIRSVVAGVAMLVVGIFAWNSLPDRRGATASAAAGKLVISAPSQQVLPDGSIVDLKEGASISVAYSDRVRHVTLQAGEAHFQVAKDPDKPFVVMAGRVAVSAVGTAFSVHTSEETVEVLVTEGRVAVDQPLAPASKISPETPTLVTRPLTFIDAGKRLVVEAIPSSSSVPNVQTVSEAELTARLAWRMPRLAFSGTPLLEILPAINRHSRTQIVLADLALQHLKLSGTLRADDIETLLGLLEEGYGVRVERRSETVVALHKSK